MSFLDSVLTSLQTGKPSQLPVSTPPAPPATSSTKRDDRNPGSAPRQPASSANANATGGIKRKADDPAPRPEASKAIRSPASRPLAKPASSKPAAKPAPATTGSRPAAPKPAPRPAPKNGPSGTAATARKAAPAKPAPSKPAAPAAPAKAPPKGSFADIMAQAKAMQAKAPSDVGTFRNQTAPKEKSSHRDLKRRMNEAKTRAKLEAQGKKFTPKPSTAERFGKKSPAEPPSRKLSEGPTYKGTAKPTQTPEPPAYRGTAGLPGKNGGNDRRHQGKRRMNEYLGTDEEDEGDYGGYEDDFYSDASSDMEAGFDDVEDEEGAALRNARKEDEEELRLEMAAKKEKMERQKRLAALASRKR